jgi:hypothetical protein
MLAFESGILAGKQDLVNAATNKLRDAQDSLTRSTDRLRDAQDRLTDAEITKRGADLMVERATLNYADAVARSGVESLEAREAQLALEQAERFVESATEDLEVAIKDETKELELNRIEVGKVEEQNKKLEEQLGRDKTAWDKLWEAIQRTIDRYNEWKKKTFGEGEGGSGGAWTPRAQHGGIVPGRAGQAVPIIAHAGERVVPRGGVDVNAGMGGGPININFYGNMQIDSEQRVHELAQQINRILGRQSELSRYGAGF